MWGDIISSCLFARCVDIMGADLSRGCVRPRVWIVGKYMYMDPICSIDIIYAMCIGTFRCGVCVSAHSPSVMCVGVQYTFDLLQHKHPNLDDDFPLWWKGKDE